jgi:hypothetical protein
MTDLVTFRGNRPPRRAAGTVTVSLGERATSGALLSWLRDLVAQPVGEGEYYPKAQRTARGWLLPENGILERVDPDALELQLHPVADGTQLLWLVSALDRWLTTQDNAPTPQAFADQLAALFHEIKWTPSPSDHIWLPDSANSTAEQLLDTLVAALLLPEQALPAHRINRLMMVYLLLVTWAERSRQSTSTPTSTTGALFATAEEIFSLLRHRVIALPNPPFPAVLPAHRIKLVREATVADLWVVRTEWRCYVAGEIADIRNLMAHERLGLRSLRIDETEITTTAERQQISITDTSTETTETSEFANVTHREMDLAIHAEGQVNTSGRYGATKVDTHFGANVDYSLKDASDRATRLARSAIARASAHEETRVRSERVERTLTRFELEQTHGFDPSDKAERGLYRWVDRIDRLQMYRFPDRLQLEFQLPEPGQFLYEVLAAPPRTARLKDPGEFTFKAADVTVDTYADLAIKYEAAAVPTPQQATLSVSAGLSTDKIELPADGAVTWNPPTGSHAVELAIPTGYAATGAVVAAHATPIMGKWHREDTAHVGFEDDEGFHTLTISVAVGEQVFTAANAGTGNGQNSVQNTGTSQTLVQYLEAVTDLGASAVLDPPVTGKVPVSLSTVGASSAAATVEMSCVLTTDAQEQWRQGVLDALLAGHAAQVRAYRDEQDQLGLGQALYERSPTRNAEMIREELKRLAVGWLLDESPFAGRDAVRAASTDIDLDKARAVADDIQFLEQALEWTNLVYVPYPYYWARRGQWPQLEKIQTADPDLARFLRAGSVRLVVPARPGFAEEVQHWLLWRQPWGGGPPPVPGDPLYVSVAEEVRDLTQPPPDGEPGESWEVRLPTTLQWLDTSDMLPHNPVARLGAPPHAPADPMCPDGPHH